MTPQNIKLSTEEKYAVFLIERHYEEMENVSEKVTEILAVFNTPSQARNFIKNNHKKGFLNKKKG